MFTNLDFEKSLWEKGIDLIAGVDEVGRGALAGPMVVGAVILKPQELTRVYKLPKDNDVPSLYIQIKDSKLLSAKKRAVLSDFIIQNCLCYSVFQVSNKEIDSLGLSACTQKAFSGAIKSLKIKPEHVLTDAFPIKEFPQTIQTNIKAGDRLSLTISAASIVAKVFRDSLMCDLGKQEKFKVYGFEKHKGYGTRLHKEKIAQHGISNMHRRTFIHF